MRVPYDVSRNIARPAALPFPVRGKRTEGAGRGFPIKYGESFSDKYGMGKDLGPEEAR